MNVIERIERGELAVIKCMSCSEGHRLRNYAKAETGELLRLAQLGQAMQWVSVDERLPEPFETVVVYTGNRILHGFYDSDIKRIVLYCYSQTKATHWMPLPPAPGVKP